MPGSVGSPNSELAIAYVQIREVAAEPGRDLAVQAQRRGDDLLRVGDAQSRCRLLARFTQPVVSLYGITMSARLRARRGERPGQVGLALVVADRLDRHAGRLQPRLDRRGALR